MRKLILKMCNSCSLPRLFPIKGLAKKVKKVKEKCSTGKKVRKQQRKQS